MTQTPFNAGAGRHRPDCAFQTAEPDPGQENRKAQHAHDNIQMRDGLEGFEAGQSAGLRPSDRLQKQDQASDPQQARQLRCGQRVCRQPGSKGKAGDRRKCRRTEGDYAR